ncbi:MAG: family 43 glycosylhydrolase, partial [Thermoleophilaceae bacterium]
RPPKWAKINFWAPEITKLGNGRYAVYYSARSRRKGDRWFCVGMATAPTATGPYRDLGKPLRCGRYGSIDPYPTRDENGRPYLLFKDDGNQFHRPTHIYAQPLSADGTRVSGTPKELLRNRPKSWEGKVVEAPNVVRVGDYFQLVYAGGLFGGTKGCDYAIGVARSKTLLGPYERFPGNPIVKSGNGWKCPGHASVYPDASGGLHSLYHAYRSGRGVIAGRQMISEPATIGDDGWLKIGDNGTPPTFAPGAAPLSFKDGFRTLDPNWEWPFMRRPGIATGNGLRLRGSSQAGRRLDAGVLARRTSTPNYTATAVVDKRALRGAAQGGLASFRSESESIGVSLGRSELTVWQRDRNRFKLLAAAKAPRGNVVHLRMVARGDRFQFESSPNGTTWKKVGRRFRGPIEESARPALTSGGALRSVARFVSASVTEN